MNAGRRPPRGGGPASSGPQGSKGLARRQPFEAPRPDGWRARLHEVIFEAETPAGKAFDVALLVCILCSVLVVMLDSVSAVREGWGSVLTGFEWFFTILFSIEYILRLLCVKRPSLYARSFFGVVDLLAILPTYAGLVLPHGRYFMIVRILRLIRVFRIFKLVPYVSEANMLAHALHNSRRKIMVFLFSVLLLTFNAGAIMYVVEGEEHGFTSIPGSVYWAIVTMTTVGYGDISPQTPLGQTLAAILMVLGYSVIAVPTGIVTAELTQSRKPISNEACETCGGDGHDPDADFCKHCGSKL